jgi:ribosomal protein L11 methyltransferase
VDWLEISVTTDGEAAEAVIELFNRWTQGKTAVETPVDCFEDELTGACPETSVVVKTYLPIDASVNQLRRHLEEGLWHLSQLYPIPEPVSRRLGENDWAEAWKKEYHLQRIGRHIVIVPTWELYEPGDKEFVIRLEPGMAFGTGLHPTTRLCLQAMEDHLRPGSTVLDVGTGSGILAIAAVRLGAGSVLALDADLAAVTVARENVAMNGTSTQVVVRHGTLRGGDAVPRYFAPDSELDVLGSGQFDLILINILAPVIVSVAPELALRLKPSGKVIAAGLIETQERDVVEAFRVEGLHSVERTQEKDWVALVAQQR